MENNRAIYGIIKHYFGKQHDDGNVKHCDFTMQLYFGIIHHCDATIWHCEGSGGKGEDTKVHCDNPMGYCYAYHESIMALLNTSMAYLGMVMTQESNGMSNGVPWWQNILL